MKIISKHKDYYDYLQGIYGIDEKLVLDRASFTPMTNVQYRFNNLDKVEIILCDFIIEGIFYDDEFLYGKELESFDLHSKRKNIYRYDNKFYYIDDNSKRDLKILKEPFKIDSINSPNTKLECPILINKHPYNDDNDDVNDNKYLKFPILKEYNLYKVFSPEQIFLMLSEWLGREKIIINNQTDKDKILASGFDLKTSFRKM